MNVTVSRLDNTMKQQADSQLNITTCRFSRDTKTIVYTSCIQRDHLYRLKSENNMRAASKSTFNSSVTGSQHIGVPIRGSSWQVANVRQFGCPWSNVARNSYASRWKSRPLSMGGARKTIRHCGAGGMPGMRVKRAFPPVTSTAKT